MKKCNRWMSLGTLLVVTLVGNLWAQDPTLTKITFSDMHCAGCAKTVAKTLQSMPGVAQAGADFQSRTAMVKPMPQVVLSPKALWEAMEKINQKPARIDGPNGSFTAKPQS